MPIFNKYTPKTQGDMADIRKKAKLERQSLPVGVIGENTLFSWGYNGDYYYVAEGVLEHLVTQMHLTLDEAKQLYEALTFCEHSEPSATDISLAVKEGRKKSLSGDELMYFLMDTI
jgi:hypothetical protein